MMKRLCWLIVLAPLFGLSTGSAFAETVWDVLVQTGWPGVWSVSCREPPSHMNYWITYFKDADGVARRKVDTGADRPALMGVVESARILTDTTMAARIRNDDENYGPDNGVAFDLVVTTEGGRKRTLESKSSTGRVYIKDGIIIVSGKPSPWLERCAD